MKKIVFFFLMTILIASCHQEELSSVPDEPEGKQGSPDKPGGLSIQLCKSEKKEFYIRYSS